MWSPSCNGGSRAVGGSPSRRGRGGGGGGPWGASRAEGRAVSPRPPRRPGLPGAAGPPPGRGPPPPRAAPRRAGGGGPPPARACAEAGFGGVEQRRITTTLAYADADAASDAAFVGGPVAMAWSHFDAPTRARARARYLESIEPWRQGGQYRMPGEFVIVSGV